MFTNVQIIPALNKGNLIQWTVEPGVPDGSIIEIRRSSNGVSWDTIGKVTRTYFFVDSTFDTRHGFDTNYKLVLNDTYEYVVTSFIGALPKKDRNIIKNIRRKESLLQIHGGGRPGWLLKRLQDDSTVLSEADYSGGFYNPVVYNTLSVSSQLNRTKKTTQIGTYSQSKDVTRGLVYPIVDMGDVWVDKFTDRRYWITGLEEVLYRGIPIIYSKMEMSLVPPLSEIYKIPVGEQR